MSMMPRKAVQIVAKDRNGHIDALTSVFKSRRLAEKGIPPCDDAFMGSFPNLFDIMTRVWLDETHKVSRAGRVEVENCSGLWLWKLHCPSMGAFKELTVTAWEQGLPALERVLLDPLFPWRFYPKMRPVRVQEVSEKEKEKLDKIHLRE